MCRFNFLFNNIKYNSLIVDCYKTFGIEPTNFARKSFNINTGYIVPEKGGG